MRRHGVAGDDGGRRTLALRRETLTELSTGDLSVVAGGAQALPTEPVQYCLMSMFVKTTCGGPSGSTQCPDA